MNYKDILAMASAYKEVAEGSYKTTKKEAMDPVDAKALKGKHKDRKDKDIDNDGDVDSSDEYLHKRRKAVSKAIKGKGKETEVEVQTQESVEELDELSKKTLGDYVKTAGQDAADHGQDMGKHYANKAYTKGVKSANKMQKRIDGIKTATNKLTKEEAQLDELSNKTLSSYAKKASADNKERRVGVMKPLPIKDMDKNISQFKKMKSREKGINTAASKLTKEAADHGNMNNGSPSGEGLSPSAKKELDRTTPMNPATDEKAVNALNFKTFKAMAKKAPMRSGDNAAGDKTPPKTGK